MAVVNHYNIICDRLLALKSWTEEEKSSLLHIIVNWRNRFENSIPEKLEENMRCLREILTDNIIIEPILPVHIVLEVIQSDNIPAELWLDCLRTAVQSYVNNDTDYQNTISFDFTPVIMPTIGFNLQSSNTTSSTHRNKGYVLVLRS